MRPVTTPPSQISPAARRLVRAVDEVTVRAARHWLAVFIGLLLLFQVPAVLAPVLMRAGYQEAAGWIYRFYEPLCHQLAYRSWFLFGSQGAYTVSDLQAHLDVVTPPSDTTYWRSIVGDGLLGFKMAICERDLAIYAALLLAAIVYGVLRRVRPIPFLDWRVLILVFCVPIGLDGFTQLFGWRESDPLLRTLTGAWFGLGSAWLFLPNVEDAMSDLYLQTKTQLARLDAHYPAGAGPR